MTIVTVSADYELPIPEDVRARPAIRPGQELRAFAVGSCIEYVPVEPARSIRGLLPDLPPFERRSEG